MSDLISREALIKDIHELRQQVFMSDEVGHNRPFSDKANIIECINNQPTSYDVEYEIRLLKNYINKMPKVYRKRNVNWVIVRDLLMQGTSTSGRTSCITKCYELGIDPWGYEVKGAAKDE